jgi:hypothetical protein
MRQRWNDFFDRLETRLIRVLDVLSILLFDATIIGFGYFIIHMTELLSESHSKFFDAAREVSSGVFLLLYLMWVGNSLSYVDV